MPKPSSFSRWSSSLLFCAALFAVGCDSDGGGGGDAGPDTSVPMCGTCGTNAHCDTAASSPACVCDTGFTGDGQTCTAAPTCSPGCGTNATCKSNLECVCNAGYHGDPIGGCVNTAVDACTVNPCLNGGTCAVNGSGYTCTCAGGATGTNCETPGSGQSTYTDIVYALTASFEVRDTPAGIGDQKFTGLTTNATTPCFQDPGQVTPFARSMNNCMPTAGATTEPTPAFTRGFARLRFTNDATGHPIAGSVWLVEWYIPLEFTQTKGAMLYANTDHSVGLIDTTLTNCGGGDTACMNHAPALARTCAKNAQGVLVGRTLTWDMCTPAPTNMVSWNFVMARGVSGPGCAAGYNGFGNTTTTSVVVPNAGKRDSYQTWNQKLSGFVFSGTDPMTATFTVPAYEIPNGTNTSTTWVTITATSIIDNTLTGSTPGTDLVCETQ